MSEFQVGGVFKGALAGGVAAGVVNVVLYLAGGAIGAEYLMLQPGATEKAPIPVFMPFVMSVVPALVGAGLFAILLKVVPAKAWTVFLALSALAFVLMLPGPPMQMGGDMPAIIVLELMHVVVAGAVIGGIHRMGRG